MKSFCKKEMSVLCFLFVSLHHTLSKKCFASAFAMECVGNVLITERTFDVFSSQGY